MKRSKNKTKQRRYTEAERQTIIKEYKAGNSSQASIAKKHGICKATIQNWLRSHRKQKVKTKPQKFLPVRIFKSGIKERSLDHTFEVILKSDRYLRFSSGFDPKEIRSLIKILEESC